MKRIPVKWIRDGAKSAYKKDTKCFICSATENLELHHTNGLTNLLMKWAKDNEIEIDTDEKILAVRDEFIAQHHKEIYEEVFTLCSKHHKKLHSIYGKSPLLSTSPKQIRWVHLQKEKYETNGLVQREGKPSTANNSPRGRFTSLI